MEVVYCAKDQTGIGEEEEQASRRNKNDKEIDIRTELRPINDTFDEEPARKARKEHDGRPSSKFAKNNRAYKEALERLGKYISDESR